MKIRLVLETRRRLWSHSFNEGEAKLERAIQGNMRTVDSVHSQAVRHYSDMLHEVIYHTMVIRLYSQSRTTMMMTLVPYPTDEEPSM